MPVLTAENLHDTQRKLYWNPACGLKEDLHEVYSLNELEIGLPEGLKSFRYSARKNTLVILGAMYGDEGKGKLVDYHIENFLDHPGIKQVYVIRFQGGNNAGHTIEAKTPSGIPVKLDLHQIPSGVLHPGAIEIMEKGMVIHPEDLITEVDYVEKASGNDLHGKLFLSEDATLTTDLERAEEWFNQIISKGRSDGGTSRGISPSYAHRTDRTGKLISDLMADNWHEVLGNRYDYYQTYFQAFGHNLASTVVPDFKATHETNINITRTVGSRETFLGRLGKTREELIKRGIVINTNPLYHQIYGDESVAILIEGAQGLGLRRNIGIFPDVTSSDTSSYGIDEGTGILSCRDISEAMAILKAIYTTKVPFQPLPTAVKMPADFPTKIESMAILDNYIQSHRSILNSDQLWALWIIKAANEIGVTTKRPRIPIRPDLEALRFFLYHGGVDTLSITHLDIARRNNPETNQSEPFKISLHYEDNDGRIAHFEPRLDKLAHLKPVYESLPGWDGEEVKKARTWEELPLEAKQYLAFLQRRTGYPITYTTTGPRREQIIQLR